MKAIFLLLVAAAIMITIPAPRAGAMGLASSYLEDKTMLLKPGEERDYSIELQNVQEQQVGVAFNLDSWIAQVVDPQPTYLIGGNVPTKEIVLHIKVPEYAVPNNTYSVSYSIIPIQGEGQIGLNFRLSDSFIVKVIPGEIKQQAAQLEQPSIPTNTVPIAIAIFALIFACAIISIKVLHKADPKK